jgi:hypothetical protein
MIEPFDAKLFWRIHFFLCIYIFLETTNDGRKFISADTSKLQRSIISDIMLTGSLPTMHQIANGGDCPYIGKAASMLHGVLWLAYKLP